MNFLHIVLGCFCGVALWEVATYLFKKAVVRVAIWIMTDEKLSQAREAISDTPFPVDREIPK